MISLKHSLLTVLLLAAFSAHAQKKESAPQEPPYTQENEFDTAPSNTNDEVLSIEDELKSSEPKIAQPQKAPDAVPSESKKQDSVNLNEKVPEAGSTPIEQEMQKSVSAEEDSAVIPVAPVVNVRPSDEIKQGEVVRQSPKGGIEYIHHPQAAKGLLMIEKDGTYIYKTKDETKFDHTGTFRIGTMDAPTILSKDGTTNFVTMYHGSPVPVFMFDYEWQPFTSFGRLGVTAGLAAMIAQGNGRFACDNCGTLNGTEAKEKYTFVALPLSLGVTYRLEWKSRQWVAPYLSAGGTYIPVVEMRDDNKSPNAVGTPGAYGAAGLMFNISAVDRETAFTLKNEYQISNLWLTAEYRYLKTFNEELDFSSSIMTLGIGVDY